MIEVPTRTDFELLEAEVKEQARVTKTLDGAVSTHSSSLTRIVSELAELRERVKALECK